MQQSIDFHHRVGSALHDPQIRSNFRQAMDGLMYKRQHSFPDADELLRLRRRSAEIRINALSRLPELLEQLETRCSENGIQVHWAETTEQANAIVLDIMNRHDAGMLIKGKSMVSEEMELNHYLEQHGVT
ncbi:MAG: lactate utilization protein, partial [Gammaproteobacteria bacterium]|nr:lactate utilization protein [Gammaproteobacteria bacterium]